MKHNTFYAAALTFLALSSATASAAQSSSTLTNSAQVQSACSISTINSIQFPPIDGLALSSYNPTSSGSVLINCTAGSYNLMITNGRLPIGGSGIGMCLQRMLSTKDSTTIQYALYTSSSYTKVYPSGVSSSTCPASSSMGIVYISPTFTSATRSQQVPIYASIIKDSLLNNAVTVGGYTDTVTAIINF